MCITIWLTFEDKVTNTVDSFIKLVITWVHRMYTQPATLRHLIKLNPSCSCYKNALTYVPA